MQRATPSPEVCKLLKEPGASRGRGAGQGGREERGGRVGGVKRLESRGESGRRWHQGRADFRGSSRDQGRAQEGGRWGQEGGRKEGGRGQKGQMGPKGLSMETVAAWATLCPQDGQPKAMMLPLPCGSVLGAWPSPVPCTNTGAPCGGGLPFPKSVSLGDS